MPQYLSPGVYVEEVVEFGNTREACSWDEKPAVLFYRYSIDYRVALNVGDDHSTG